MMCDRSDASNSLKEAAEALRRACVADPIGCNLKLAYAAPDDLPQDLQLLIDRMSTSARSMK